MLGGVSVLLRHGRAAFSTLIAARAASHKRSKYAGYWNDDSGDVTDLSDPGDGVVWGYAASVEAMRRKTPREHRLDRAEERAQSNERAKAAAVKTRARPREGIAISTRQIAFTEQIRRSMENIFAHETLRDIVLRSTPLIVTNVTVSRDRHRATIRWDYDSATATRVRPESLIARLASAAPHIRSLLSKRLHSRHVPELDFVRDTTDDDETQIENAVREGHPEDFALLESEIETLEAAVARELAAVSSARAADSKRSEPWLWEDTAETALGSPEAVAADSDDAVNAELASSAPQGVDDQSDVADVKKTARPMRDAHGRWL